MSASNRSTYEFSGFHIDPVRRVLSGPDGKPIFLKPKAFETLLYLVEHPGELCDKRDLMAAVWPGLVVEENNLNQCISALRRALGERRGEHKFILTEPGRGYRFVTTVSSAPVESGGRMDEIDMTVEAKQSLSQSRSAQAARARPFGRRWNVVIVAALVMALGYFAWARYGGRRASDGGATAVTLAVLPFTDLSPGKDQGYFADGIAEAISISLQRVKGLDVIQSESSFQLKGTNQDERAIGETLHAEYLLKGSVSKDGDEIRIRAHLINAETLKQPWSDEYERKLADVFAVQDEIAMAVANALQVTLGVGAIAEIPGMTRNVEAYDEDLKGNALFQLYTPDSVRQAVEHLRRAVFLDPKFARAWLDLATLYTNGGLVVPDQAAAWQELAVGAGENAQKAAPDSPYVALTNLELKARDGRWLEAGRIYQDYLPLAVKYGLQKDDWMGGGLFLLRVGKVHDAIAALELAKSANPLSGRVAANLAEAYSDAGSSDAGKLAQSLQEFDRGLRLRGNEGILRAAGLFAALATGDRDEIRNRLAATGSSRELGELLDDPAAALDRIRQMAKQAGNNLWDYGSLAVWAAYYSDPELALDLQRKFVSVNKSFVATTSLWRPIFRDVRKLPGFKDLVHRMGLVDYWRANGWNDFCRQVGDEDFECTGPWP